jgi:heme-degrading monooxygenase HmoA
MIKRIWHGWTTSEMAEVYERLLRTEVFARIAAKQVVGYRGIELLRRPVDNGEVEFVTIMTFDDLAAVRSFAGDEYERAYVPAAARRVLRRFDERSQHYEVCEQLAYQGS